MVVSELGIGFLCRWECLKEILVGDWTDGIVCSIGMPIIKDSERYNCQVLCLNRKILMIRPKMWLTAWKQRDELVDFQLPREIAEALGQKSVPFGYGFVKFQDTYVTKSQAMFLNFPLI